MHRTRMILEIIGFIFGLPVLWGLAGAAMGFFIHVLLGFSGMFFGENLFPNGAWSFQSVLNLKLVALGVLLGLLRSIQDIFTHTRISIDYYRRGTAGGYH